MFRLLISVFLLMNTVLFAQDKKMEVKYYSGQDKFFRLESTLNSNNELFFSGTSKYNSCWIQLKKIDNNNNVLKERDLKFSSENNEADFNYKYRIKDGPGTYKVIIFGNNKTSGRYTGVCYYEFNVVNETINNKEYVGLNKEIWDFAEESKGKKIGRGECWDLIQEALDRNNADWKRTTQYGIKLDYLKDEILPGDIVQIYKMKIVYTKGNTTHIETLGLPNHTAIIYKVLSKGHYILIHQNVGGKRYLITSELNLEYKKEGRIDFYRPVQGLVKVQD